MADTVEEVSPQLAGAAVGAVVGTAAKGLGVTTKSSLSPSNTARVPSTGIQVFPSRGAGAAAAAAAGGAVAEHGTELSAEILKKNK